MLRFVGGWSKNLKQHLKTVFLANTANAGFNIEALLAQVEAEKPGFGVNVNSPEKGLWDISQN